MGIFSKKKKLIDYDPKKLSLEMLSQLQASLIAKLMLVNKELIHRYVNIVDLSGDLPDTGKSRAVLKSGAKRLQEFNCILETELAHILGKDKDNEFQNIQL